MDYNFIWEAVMILLSGIISYYLIPYLKNQGLYFWVLTAVKAAEEIYSDVEKAGIIKEDMVRQFLLDRGIFINEALVTIFIKRAVTELKKG